MLTKRAAWDSQLKEALEIGAPGLMADHFSSQVIRPIFASTGNPAFENPLHVIDHTSELSSALAVMLNWQRHVGNDPNVDFIGRYDEQLSDVRESRNDIVSPQVLSFAEELLVSELIIAEHSEAGSTSLSKEIAKVKDLEAATIKIMATGAVMGWLAAPSNPWLIITVPATIGLFPNS